MTVQELQTLESLIALDSLQDRLRQAVADRDRALEILQDVNKELEHKDSIIRALIDTNQELQTALKVIARQR